MNDTTKTNPGKEHAPAPKGPRDDASGIPVRVPGIKTDPPAVPMPRPKKPVKKGGLLNTHQAAVFLGLKPSTLRTWRCTQAVELKHVKLGSAVRYRESDLADFIETNLEGGE